MNAMIPKAFTDSPWAFALSMLAIQLGLTLSCIVSMTDRLYRAHYARMMVWLMAMTPLWLIGASSTSETRLAWWGGATAIELIATWLAHPIPGHWLRSEKLEFDGEHIFTSALVCCRTLKPAVGQKRAFKDNDQVSHANAT